MQKPNVLKYLEALIGETPLMEFNSSKPSNWKKILQIITTMAAKRYIDCHCIIGTNFRDGP